MSSRALMRATGGHSSADAIQAHKVERDRRTSLRATTLHPVQRQVIGVLGRHQVGQQTRAGQPLRD
jgi:hypothetical protein